jgi:hypothetical protein
MLSSLKVGKGGRGEEKDLGPDWTIGFYENLGSQEQPYRLVLRFRYKSSTMGLLMSEVFTKSKGMWRRDQVWRLKPETVSRVAENIHSVMAKQPSEK